MIIDGDKNKNDLKLIMLRFWFYEKVSAQLRLFTLSNIEFFVLAAINREYDSTILNFSTCFKIFRPTCRIADLRNQYFLRGEIPQFFTLTFMSLPLQPAAKQSIARWLDFDDNESTTSSERDKRLIQ